MFGHYLKSTGPNNHSMFGALFLIPITALIRPASVAVFMFVALAISFVRRELASVRKWAVSLLMRHIRILQAASLIVMACAVGCNQPDKFAGFASEQLNTKMDEVLSIIEAQTGTIQSLSRQVAELNQVIENTQSASESQITRLQTLESKLKAKLTSTPKAEVDGVGTLDTENAPSATLTLDTLDEAAEQIMALQKRIGELEKRCNSFASAKPTYQSVSSSSSYGSTGGVSSSGSGCTGGVSVASYSQPVYSQPVYSEPVVYSQPVYSETVYQSSSVRSSGPQCVDEYGNPVPCNQTTSTTSQPRKGLLGRMFSR